MRFATHGNGKGLDDLYIIPDDWNEGQKVADYLRSRRQKFEWFRDNVTGRQSIDIPFGESLRPEIEAWAAEQG